MRWIPLCLLACASQSFADPPRIENIKALHSGTSWRFDVTLSHQDTGWDDYADGWRIVDMQGNQLGLRVLHHPHVNEQPFTRSLSGVNIPEGTRQIKVEARDSVGGWSNQFTTFTLP